jgi:hypothetical protein
MSHFTQIKTKIQDIEYLKKALTKLGYNYQEGNLEIKGYSGLEKVSLAVYPEGNSYPIGFRKKGKEYEIIADWWGVKVERDKFIKSVTQTYSYLMVINESQKQGFNIVSEEKLLDGAIKVVVQKWR